MNSPRQIKLAEWYASYAKKFGAKKLASFIGGFGPGASIDNPFVTGRYGMVNTGMWNIDTLERYGPNVDWGGN